MTTVVYHSYNSIPYMSGSYAGAPQRGPMSTNQTPGQIPYHSYSALAGIHPNPAQFQSTDGSSQFSNARRQYQRTNTTRFNMGTGTKDYCDPGTKGPLNYYSAETQRQFAQSKCTKYNAPKCASLYISARKSAAVGKSSYKVGLPTSAPMSYGNIDRNDVKTRLQRARSGGCVAPAKQGSIFNYSCSNGRACAWGSLVSQNY
jgi:hypothetical protein